ncbi:MAG: hypothetical protein J5825_02650 [Lachnospiraceae bacterium]|nr:hypothetical protein [Lachnospiraceae bacterium]
MTEADNPSAIRAKKEITEALISLMKDDPEYVKQTLIVYLKRIRMIRDHDKDDMKSDKGTV